MQAILFQQMQQMRQEHQQMRQENQQHRDLTQLVLLHLGQQQKQISGSLSLQLHTYQAQMQRRVVPVSHSLKRSADNMQSKAQPASKNAMRRQKQKLRLEKNLHDKETAVQQQQMQELSERQAGVNRMPSGATLDDDAEHADISNASPAAAGPSSESSPAADVQAGTGRSSVQPAVHRKDIPGDGRGRAGWARTVLSQVCFWACII